MKKKRGVTLVEFVISLALVTIVLLFLFNLLLDVQYTTKNGSFARDNQINRASILRTVLDDFSELGLVGMTDTGSNANRLILKFSFQDGTNKTLTVQEKMVSYGDEKWSMKSSNSVTTYQTSCIPYQFVNHPSSSSNQTSCTSETCSDYFYIQFRIPVVIGDHKDNTMDDLDFFYVGESSSISDNAFPAKLYLGYSASNCP